MIFSLILCNIDLFPQTRAIVDIFPHTTIPVKIPNTLIVSTRPIVRLSHGCQGWMSNFIEIYMISIYNGYI